MDTTEWRQIRNEHKPLSTRMLVPGILSDEDLDLIDLLIESKEDDEASRAWVRRVHKRLQAFFTLDDHDLNRYITDARKRLKYAEKQQTKRITSCSTVSLADKFNCSPTKIRSVSRRSMREIASKAGL